MMRNIFLFLVSCLAAPAMAQGEVPTNHGFLSSYAQLKPVEGQKGVFRYIDPQANVRPYNKVTIDPVRIIVAPGGDAKALSPEVVQRMSEAFRMEFVGAMLSGYQVVNQPGPGVMRIRLAITGVQPAKQDMKASDLIPIKALFNLAREAADGTPRVAEMSAEMEVLDPNGRVVGAGVATRKAGQALPQGESITWNDLQSVAAVWAKNLRQQIDYLRSYAAN